MSVTATVDGPVFVVTIDRPHAGAYYGGVIAAPLTAEMLRFKRTDERFERGLAPVEAHRVIGRRASRPIQADETIREDLLE